jgi:hypothetical protein
MSDSFVRSLPPSGRNSVCYRILPPVAVRSRPGPKILFAEPDAQAIFFSPGTPMALAGSRKKTV